MNDRVTTPQHKNKSDILFNDALNTFYLWLYGIRHMVKDHTDSERGNPPLPHGLVFPINNHGVRLESVSAVGTVHIPTEPFYSLLELVLGCEPSTY